MIFCTEILPFTSMGKELLFPFGGIEAMDAMEGERDCSRINVRGEIIDEGNECCTSCTELGINSRPGGPSLVSTSIVCL